MRPKSDTEDREARSFQVVMESDGRAMAGMLIDVAVTVVQMAAAAKNNGTAPSGLFPRDVEEVALSKMGCNGSNFVVCVDNAELLFQITLDKHPKNVVDCQRVGLF